MESGPALVLGPGDAGHFSSRLLRQPPDKIVTVPFRDRLETRSCKSAPIRPGILISDELFCCLEHSSFGKELTTTSVEAIHGG